MTHLSAMLLLGDMPPPPPSLPGTGITLPHPLHWLIAGVVLALAVATLVRQAARRGSPQKRKWTTVLSLLAAVALAGTVYSAVAYSVYAKVRRNYRGPGPPIRHPVPPSDEPLPPLESIDDDPTEDAAIP